MRFPQIWSGRGGPARLAIIALLLTGCPAKPPAPPTPAPTPADAPQKSLSAADCAELARLRNLALGALENEKLTEAEQHLTAIAKLAPDNLLVKRNVAVLRHLGLQVGTMSAAAAQAAINDLQSTESSARDAWLVGRIGVTLAEKETDATTRETVLGGAIQSLQKAQQLDTKRPAIPWEIYEALRYGSPDQQVIAQAAIVEAARRAPDNLFVLTERLLQQADAKDPALVETLDHLQQIAGPLRDGIQRRARVDILDLIATARTAVGANQWPQATGRVRTLNAVLRPEDQAQSDRRQLSPHPLMFVMADFDPAICDPPSPSVVPTPITFAAEAFPLPPTLTDLRSVEIADFQLDGWPDLWILGESAFEIWSRTAVDQPWKSAQALPLAGDYAGLIAVDFDRDTVKGLAQPATGVCHDADADLVLFGPAGIAVYRNELNAEDQREFVPVEQTAGLNEVRNVSTAIPGDFDHDGDLDLALWTDTGLQLWMQTGGMIFTNNTDRVQLPPQPIHGTKLIAVDWDRDVDLDLVVISTLQQGYFENLRHGEFRWQPFNKLPGEITSVVTGSVAELDGNVSWDLVLSGPAGVETLLTTTVPAQSVTFESRHSLSSDIIHEQAVGDWNNDGWQDVCVANAQGLQVFAGQRGTNWTAMPTHQDAGFVPQNLKTADLDNDGRLDVVAFSPDQLAMLQNTSDSSSGWLTVRVRGDEDPQSGRVNQYGIGSLVEVRTGDHYQAQVITGQVTHFGLGTAAEADTLRVLWTNGVPQVTLQPARNQALCERLALKGSCPYLYTWDGERFAFFTDLLWAAPLGLQFAEGVLAPSRPWEYLLVDGDALKEHKGQYDIRVTEELWEAAYFDQIELLAIDHPAEVEVFSNEKVGPPDIAAMQVHTVRERRLPVSAHDQRGRDVSDQLRDIDDRYVKAFDTEYRQGLTEPHYLELDLGEFQQPQKIVLFLTGWIYPTDTSLNVALSQDPHLDGPRPPSLSVPDAAGNWQVVRPFMGFPGGKTKTIAIDVSDAFLTDDYRLRIETTHEIYWDAAFFTVDEDPAEVRVTPLQLTAADLRYRGFSASVPPREHAPERYDYQQVSIAPKWPPMLGHFTRYGEVRELLTATDDRLVVLGSGDEIALSFAVPLEPLPTGWKRDFFLHNVGWDKDADLHTVYGQMVEPLPYVAMPGYPYLDQTGPTESPAYREYLQRYQTRTARMADYWRLPLHGSLPRSTSTP